MTYAGRLLGFAVRQKLAEELSEELEGLRRTVSKCFLASKIPPNPLTFQVGYGSMTVQIRWAILLAETRQRPERPRSNMKKIMMIRALFALAVTLCAAIVAAQEIRPGSPEAAMASHLQRPPPIQGGAAVDNLDGRQTDTPQGDPVENIDGRSASAKEAQIQELGVIVRQAEKVLATETRPAVRGQAISASCNAKQEISRLRQELSALRSGQARLSNKVKNLDSKVNDLGGRMGKLEKSDEAQNDLLLGKKGQDGKRTGGLVGNNAKLQDWRKKLDASLAGPDGEFGTADDVVTEISSSLKETNADVYGYKDESGKDHPGVLEVVWGKDGKSGLRQGFAVLKEQIAGAASQGAVWWVGVIAVLALLLSGFNFLAGRKSSSTSTSGGGITLTSCTPSSGAAGAALKISGSGFTAKSKLMIGGKAAGSVTFVSSTELEAKIPAGLTAGTKYTVRAENPDGKFAEIKDGFTAS